MIVIRFTNQATEIMKRHPRFTVGKGMKDSLVVLRSRTIIVIAVALAAALGATACGAIEEMAAQADCASKYSDNVNLDEDATPDEILEAQENLLEDEEFLNCGKGGEADETDSVDPSDESAQTGAPADDSGEAVGPDAVAESLFAQMESILGPTDDIAAQVNPLLYVPALPVLPGSHIVTFDTQVARRFDESGAPDGTVGYSNSVTVKVDGELTAVAEQYSTQLSSSGWTQKDKNEGEAWDGSPQSVASYSSVDEGWMQLTITDDIELGYLHASFWYVPDGPTPDSDGSLATRFAGWHGEVPIFEGTSWSSSNIGTSIDFDTGRTSLSLYEIYRGGDVLSDEYVEDELLVLVDQAEAMGLTANYELGDVYLSPGIFDSLEMSKGGEASIRLTGRRLIDAPAFQTDAFEIDATSSEELDENGPGSVNDPYPLGVAVTVADGGEIWQFSVDEVRIHEPTGPETPLVGSNYLCASVVGTGTLESYQQNSSSLPFFPTVNLTAGGEPGSSSQWSCEAPDAELAALPSHWTADVEVGRTIRWYKLYRIPLDSTYDHVEIAGTYFSG